MLNRRSSRAIRSINNDAMLKYTILKLGSFFGADPRNHDLAEPVPGQLASQSALVGSRTRERAMTSEISGSVHTSISAVIGANKICKPCGTFFDGSG